MEIGWILRLLLPPVLVIVVFGAVIAARRRHLARLAAVWSWLGPAERVFGAGRRWRGTVQGRALTVTWFERTLTAEVGGHPRGRLGFGRAGQPSTAVEAGREGAPAVSAGPWVGYGDGASALADDAQGALRVLLDAHDGAIRAVDLHPERGASWLARPLPARVQTSERAREWATALVELVRAAE